jgi:hypothetical protein
MGQYDIAEPRTGQKLTINAPRPPSEADLRYIWSHPRHELPQSLRQAPAPEPVRMATDPSQIDAEAVTAALPQEPERIVPPAPVTPLQMVAGVTSAPSAAATGYLADNPGDALGAIGEALRTIWRAPVTPIEDQPTMGGELQKRGVPLSEGMKMGVDLFSDPSNLIGGNLVGDIGKASIILGPKAAKGIGRLTSRLVTEVLPKFKAKAMHPSRLWSDIKNFASPQEAEWTGLSKWLDEKGNTPVTREEFTEFVEQNPIGLEETRKGYGAPGPGYEVVPSHTGEWKVVSPDGRVFYRGGDYGEAERVVSELSAGETNWNRPDLRTPGGQKYRELVLRMPEQKVPDVPPRDLKADGWTVKVVDENQLTGQRILHFKDQNGEARGMRGWTRLSPDEALKERALEFAKTDTKYTNEARTYTHKIHWPGIKNPLTHLRMDERVTTEGKTALHIDEMQSDWHQDGRERGYRNEGEIQAQLSALQEQYDPLKSKFDLAYENVDAITGELQASVQTAGRAGTGLESFSQALRDPNLKAAWRSATDIPEIRAIRDRLSDAERVMNEANEPLSEVSAQIAALERPSKLTGAVPDAPYKNTEWMGLGFRRAVIEAVESGADELTWTTGAQQSDRYDNLLDGITGVRAGSSSYSDGPSIEARIGGQWFTLEDDQV